MIKYKKWSKIEELRFGDKGGNSSDDDLSMSLGKIDIKINIKKTKDKQFIWWGKTKYKVTLKMSDKYDFKHMKEEEAGFVKRMINNYLGYYPQELKILKVYTWKMEYTYNYYY